MGLNLRALGPALIGVDVAVARAVVPAVSPSAGNALAFAAAQSAVLHAPTL